MKKIYLFGIIAISIIFSACESGQTKPEDHAPFDMWMNLVKFTSPEYLNYVAVEKDYWGDEEHLCKIRLYGRTCEELYIGSSPYIALSNDYYIIDWKWGDFIYPSTNFLINIKWPEVEARQQIWEYPSIYLTSHFVKEWAYVYYKSIDTYLNILSARNSDYIMPEWTVDGFGPKTLKGMTESEIAEYMPKVSYQDSLQEVYAKRLSQIIQDGALNKVCMFNHKE